MRTTAMLLLAGAMLAPTTFATFSGSSASTAAEGTPITDAATAEVSFPGAAGSATLPYWPRSVAPGRRLQDDVPVPTAVPLPAPTAEFCGLGNPKGNVCCGGYEECHGSCGGAGCDSWDGGAALCCARTIRKAGVECEDHADVGCLIPWSSQPSTSAVPLPAPTAVPVPAPSAVQLSSTSDASVWNLTLTPHDTFLHATIDCFGEEGSFVDVRWCRTDALGDVVGRRVDCHPTSTNTTLARFAAQLEHLVAAFDASGVALASWKFTAGDAGIANENAPGNLAGVYINKNEPFVVPRGDLTAEVRSDLKTCCLSRTSV